MDRYSVTGVAADTLMPTLWTKFQGIWRAYHLDEIQAAWPHMNPASFDSSTLNHDDFQRLANAAGEGHIETCPEATACALGLHDNEEHPEMLTISVAALTDEERRVHHVHDNGKGRYPIDLLSFHAAAQLLQDVPDLLQECSCGQDEAED